MALDLDLWPLAFGQPMSAIAKGLVADTGFADAILMRL
jgi:hypothetical protein